MKVYIFVQCNASGQQKAQVYFFQRSALAAARRQLAERDDWQEVENHETSASHFWRTPHCWMSIIPLTVLFRDWTLRRWIRNHGHAQNLNEDQEGKIKGSILKHGRAWFHPFGYGHKRRSLESHCEWVLWSKRWHLEVDVGSGDANDGVSFNFGCGLFSIYFGVEGVMPRRFIEWGRQRALKTPWLGYEYMAWPRSTGIRFFEQTIWFEIWNWDFGWHSRQPKWLSFNFSPVDFLLGKRQYTSKNRLPVPKVDSLVLPDGVYPVEVMLTEDTWKRPRWPWPTVIRRAQIDCPGGIPVPGKGENSFDCGEDAVYSLTTPAADVDQALAQLRTNILQTRSRYGGSNWKPETVSTM